VFCGIENFSKSKFMNFLSFQLIKKQIYEFSKFSTDDISFSFVFNTYFDKKRA